MSPCCTSTVSGWVLIDVYDVKPDGTIANERLFAELIGTYLGGPDGMKCDVHGNVWCTGPGRRLGGGSQRDALGRIRVPEHTANFTWGGDDMKTMFFATRKTIYAARTRPAYLCPDKNETEGDLS